jgi:hypothetical protein
MTAMIATIADTLRSAVSAQARAWRYDPSTSRRDLRLDLLRGVCLLKMVTNHVGQGHLFVVGRALGFVTAAEGFFFISGAVVGIVHGRRMLEHGLGPVTRQLLVRAAQLYIANLALVMLLMVLDLIGVLPYGSFSWLWQQRLEWPMLLAFNQPYYLHVLPRYVLFLALAPAALWLLRKGRTLWVLLASGAVWALQHRLGPGLSIGLLERPEISAFPLLSWQLLFMTGLCVGFHRERLSRVWQRHQGLLIGLAVLGWLGFVALREGAAVAGWLPLAGGTTHALLGREYLGPLRLLNLAAVFTLAMALADRLWKGLHRWTGALLLPFGQHSLYLFLMHIPVAWISRPLFSRLAASGAPFWHLVAFELALVAMLWLMIRKRFLFGLVPS